jgi:hypothetical protein
MSQTTYNLLEKGWTKITTDGGKIHCCFFWCNLFPIGSDFWSNLFPQSVVFLVQPFSKRLFFGPTFSPIGSDFWSNLFLKGCYE